MPVVRDALAGGEQKKIVLPVRGASAAGWGLLGIEAEVTV